MKTVEEVAAIVDGASVFSVCDASYGFWQIRLREDCKNLTVLCSVVRYFVSILVLQSS